MTINTNHQKTRLLQAKKVAESLYEMINDIAESHVEGVSISDIYTNAFSPT